MIISTLYIILLFLSFVCRTQTHEYLRALITFFYSSIVLQLKNVWHLSALVRKKATWMDQTGKVLGAKRELTLTIAVTTSKRVFFLKFLRSFCYILPFVSLSPFKTVSSCWCGLKEEFRGLEALTHYDNEEPIILTLFKWNVKVIKR